MLGRVSHKCFCNIYRFISAAAGCFALQAAEILRGEAGKSMKCFLRWTASSRSVLPDRLHVEYAVALSTVATVLRTAWQYAVALESLGSVWAAVYS